MEEQLRHLGITMGMTGTAIMEKMMKGEISASDLNDEQIKQVLAAWDTRNIVPGKFKDRFKKDGIYDVDVVKPVIKKEEVANQMYTQEEYDRNYVEMIEKYLKTLY